MTADELRDLAKWLEEQATAVDTLCGRTPENLSRNNLRAAARVVADFQKAQEILFSYQNNEATGDPWWAVVRNGSFGRMVMLHGPFFSRERATELLEARRHEHGPKAYVFCYSGYRSQHYRDLRAIFNPESSK